MMRWERNAHFRQVVLHVLNGAISLCQMQPLYLYVGFRLPELTSYSLNVLYWALELRIEALLRFGFFFSERFRHENKHEYDPQQINQTPVGKVKRANCFPE